MEEKPLTTTRHSWGEVQGLYTPASWERHRGGCRTALAVDPSRWLRAGMLDTTKGPKRLGGVLGSSLAALGIKRVPMSLGMVLSASGTEFSEKGSQMEAPAAPPVVCVCGESGRSRAEGVRREHGRGQPLGGWVSDSVLRCTVQSSPPGGHVFVRDPGWATICRSSSSSSRAPSPGTGTRDQGPCRRPRDDC